MLTKGVIDEDFINYKVPSMFINTCLCSFKCDRESNRKVCQNSRLADAPYYEIDNDVLIDRFIANPITKAIVIGGLEPIDTLGDLLFFIEKLNERNVTADIVIYTGYRYGEIMKIVDCLRDLCAPYRDLIIKYGRFIPDADPIYDPELGIRLASNNQYAVRYPHQTNH